MRKTVSEKFGIQGLGWIVRRVPQPPAQLASFYQTALGFRQLRPAGPTGSVMLWAGDIAMLELSALTAGPDSLARRDDFSFVMRARDYAQAKNTALKAGATLDHELSDGGRTANFRDPSGGTFGIWEASTDSSFPPDATADAIWRKGAVVLPAAPSLPSSLQDIASVTLKVADPVAMAVFYHDVLGLEVLEQPSPRGATLALGRTCVLELLSGGVQRQPLTDRNQAPDVWILRVYDHDGLAQRINQSKGTIINQIAITGGQLTYALDPEGHIFGIQQRTPNLLPANAIERVEDTVARRLWADVTD